MTNTVRFTLIATFAAAAVGAQAVTIIPGSVIIQSPPLSTGSSFAILGNSISFNLPNAIVGDGFATRTGILNIQYDAVENNPIMTADSLFVNLGSACLGTGQVLFSEQVFELDAMGNEVGGPIASSTHVFNANTSPIFSDELVFSHGVSGLRAKKQFVLLSNPDDPQGIDLAGVTIVNQSIQTVPEPATIAAVTAGLAALAARRRRS